MNTPAHLIFGAAAFSRPMRPSVNAAALAGGFLPDLSLFTMVIWQHFVLGRSAAQVFQHDFGDPYWQGIFAVDNSIPLWAAALALGLALRVNWLAAFGGAGVLHLVFDLMLHHSDARRHFWPLSDWIFVSPVSYWNHKFYGGLISPLELFTCLLLGLMLWRRFEGGPARALIVGALLLESVPTVAVPILFAFN